MKTEIDEFSHLIGKVSRQRICQLRNKRDGKCCICGKPKGDSPYAETCFICSDKNLYRIRKRTGAKKFYNHSKFDPPKPHFGGTIRELRLERGWSSRELGRRTGMTSENFSRIEHEAYHPHLKTIRRLADAFGITPSELISYHERRMERLKR